MVTLNGEGLVEEGRPRGFGRWCFPAVGRADFVAGFLADAMRPA